MAKIAQMQADWEAQGNYPLVVETSNGDVVDHKIQQNPYLKVTVRNLRAEQKDLGVDPITEQSGQILISVCSRGGEGTVESLALLDFITPYFAMRDFDLVRCHTFQAVGGRDIEGWWYENGIVNYWYNWRKLG